MAAQTPPESQKKLLSRALRVVAKDPAVKAKLEADFRDDLETEGDDADQTIARQVVASTTIEQLSASEFSTFTLLRDAIPDDLRKRLAAGHRLCLVAHMPSKSWIPATEAALSATLSNVAAELDVDIKCSVTAIGKGGYGNNRYFDVEQIVQGLARYHIVVPLLPDETIDFTIPALADLELALTPTADTLLSALRRRFDDADSRPDAISPGYVLPDALDLALRRASDLSQAFDLLERLSGAVARKAREKAEAEETERRRIADNEAQKKAKQNGGAQILRPTSPKLDELHGYGAAATWAQDLVRDLHDYRDGKLAWSDVDAGCLLHGPPGTGKTLFASAFAASAGLPFIASSFAHWQGSNGGHLGDVVKALRSTFATANANAPCILFIDEFDSIPARGQSQHHDDYWVPIVNALLECLDGTARREGLVVLAACNHPEKIDPALRRSGRLDRHFEIGLPDESALARIFAHHLPGGSPDAFERAATVLAGTTSGADVSRIAREARRVARRAGREIEADDLLQIAMPAETRSEALVRLASVHEAGHAVAALASGIVPEALSIVSSGGSGGSVRGISEGGCGRLGELERHVVILLAGRAAEEVILGEPSAGAVGDLQDATSIVKQIVGHVGLGGRLLSDDQVSGSDVESRLRDLYGRALRLIGEHRQAVEALAAIALDRRVLGQRALADFALDHGFGGGR